MDEDRTALVKRPRRLNFDFSKIPSKIIVGILTAIVPAFITSYFSYKKAKLEASIGYATLVETVNHQGKILEEGQIYSAKLEGHITAIENLLMKGQSAVITPIQTQHHAKPSVSPLPAVAKVEPTTKPMFPPKPMAPVQSKAQALPVSLDKAIDASMSK